MDASPQLIGTLTVIAIDSARYAYQYNKGEITGLAYADIMAEEIIVAAASQGTGIAFQMLLPMVPGAYFAGSIAGSMIASTGYHMGKDFVVALSEEDGFEILMPVEEKLSSGKQLLADLDLKQAVSLFQGIRIPDKEDIQIKVIQLAKN